MDWLYVAWHECYLLCAALYSIEKQRKASNTAIIIIIIMSTQVLFSPSTEKSYVQCTDLIVRNKASNTYCFHPQL